MPTATEHVHGCLRCRPDMVPDFDRADARYHDYEKCGITLRATVDGAEPGYHKGVFEGADGWVLLACDGFDAARVHACPNCTTHAPLDADGFPLFPERYEVCLEPRFGTVAVIHDCPRRLAARVRRLEAALEPLVPEAAFRIAKYGPEAG